jgi:DNA-binding MarR family transcriptional regulator
VDLSERLIEAFEARLREVELVVGARIVASWAEGAELSLEEARLLLVTATMSRPASAGDLAELAGTSIEDAYPALGRLIERGEIREHERCYLLTEAGRQSIASLDAARRNGIVDYLSDLSPDDRHEVASALGVESDS